MNRTVLVLSIALIAVAAFALYEAYALFESQPGGGGGGPSGGPGDTPITVGDGSVYIELPGMRGNARSWDEVRDASGKLTGFVTKQPVHIEQVKVAADVNSNAETLKCMNSHCSSVVITYVSGGQKTITVQQTSGKLQSTWSDPNDLANFKAYGRNVLLFADNPSASVAPYISKVEVSGVSATTVTKCEKAAADPANKCTVDIVSKNGS